ncbi:MAG: YbjN domain-containing protein [Ferruginibacter sp.]
MTTNEMVKVYVEQLCTEIGTTGAAIYNANTKAWYFTRGSAKLEVFLTSYETVTKTIRTFVRVFCPIYALPADKQKQLDLYTGALEANTQYMGVKISSIPANGFLYAVAERDIEGMDYNEFTTLISDLGYWADQLDNFLAERFGAPQTSLN